MSVSFYVFVILQVLDENDNPPVFEKSDYFVEVNENEAGVTLLYGCANDSDAGNNGRVTYHMQPSASANAVSLEFLRTHIQLIPTSNTVAIRISQPLDFEKQPQFDFALLAIDQGRSALSATANVHVTVRNVNDQAPIIRFYLHGEPLDKDYARLIISEHLMVRDENDNPPVIEQRHYSFKISEALPRHSRVGQINSTDADISPENRLTVYALRDILNANASEFLFIEAHTGIIRTRKTIDREQVQQISFVVVAQNEKSKFTSNTNEAVPGGIRSDKVFYDEASVNVEIMDENDNTPVMLARGQDPQLATGDVSPAVVDLTVKQTTKENMNPCVEFPFYFVDADDGANGAIEVTLEANPFFEFRLDNTLLCRINANSLPSGQINLFVVLQDRPIDISKTLKRRYTIRVHVVQERVSESAATSVLSNQEHSRHELPHGMHLLKPSLNKPTEKHIESEDFINRPRWRLKNAPDKLTSNGKHITESTSYANTSVTIVAILVTVSGVLCLLLLSVVFVLRRIAIQDDRQRQGKTKLCVFTSREMFMLMKL
ncbi:hypothetical protein AHF37_11113 [Paragonimus kellicotti]|nr:hypothetical protein AHF37_11113 [Paragonimus kellicotti]